MRAVNHALTGAAIGLIVGEPIIAVPAAVISHFVCDAIPHYDAVPEKYGSANKQQWLRSAGFRNALYIDACLCVALVIVLMARHPVHWLLAAVCAFAAASPDLLSLPLYLNRGHKPMTLRGFQKFASTIQWFERPIGIVVEAAWFAAGIIVLAQFIR